MKRKTIALFLTVCLGLVVALAAVEQLPKPQSKDALKKMEKAEKAVKKNELDAALALYKEVIEMEPTYAPVYFTMAQLLRSKSDFEQALVNYEKALEIDPAFILARNEYIRTLLTLSQKALEARDLKKSAAFYDKIIAVKEVETTHSRELQHAAYQLGSIAYNLQDFNRSIAAFKRFLTIPEIEKTAPINSTLANYMLGINYSRLNQPEQANPYLEKFIAAPQNETTTPWLPVSHYMLANNLYVALDKQISLIKDDKVGDALAKFDRIAEAAKASPGIPANLTKAIELKPDLEDAFVKLGNYYFFCQDFDNALKAYTDLIAKFPASSDVAVYKSFMQKIEKERDLIKELKSKKKTK